MKNNKAKLAYLIPVHTLEDEYPKMLQDCIESIKKQDSDADVYCVCPPDLSKDVSGAEPIVNEGDTDIPSQLNAAASELCDRYDYIAYIEMDDRLNSNYRKVFDLYSEEKGFDILLPLGIKSDHSSGKLTDFINSAFHSVMYSQEDDESGTITLEGLDMVKDSPVWLNSIYVSGSAISSKYFKGGFKPNVKFSFLFEFLIRSLKDRARVHVANQVTYIHTGGRKGSFSSTHFSGTITTEAMKKWVEQAYEEHTK